MIPKVVIVHQLDLFFGYIYLLLRIQVYWNALYAAIENLSECKIVSPARISSFISVQHNYHFHNYKRI